MAWPGSTNLLSRPKPALLPVVPGNDGDRLEEGEAAEERGLVEERAGNKEGERAGARGEGIEGEENEGIGRRISRPGTGKATVLAPRLHHGRRSARP